MEKFDVWSYLRVNFISFFWMSDSDSSTTKADSWASDVQDKTILDNEVKDEKKLVGSLGTLMNLLNSLLGTGILAVPSSFSAVGMVPSIIILIIMAALGHVATVMVLRLRIEAKADGYDSLVHYYYGKWGNIVFSMLALVFMTLASLSYLIVGGDMIVSWFAIANIDLSVFGYRALTVLIYALVIPIALAIPKHLKFISYFSGTTIGIFVLYVGVLLYKLIDYLIDTRSINPSVCIARIDISIFSALSVYSLAFSLPCVAISIFNEYEEDMKKRSQLSGWASFICLMIIVIPSICGYIIFGDKANGNILNSFPDNDIVMIIVRIGFFIVVSASYPLLMVTITASWSQAIFKVNNASDLEGWRRYVILLIANSFPLCVGMFLPNVKPAIAIGGAFGGCMVDFTFPGLLWVKASKNGWLKWDNILCVILVIFGIIVAVLSTYYSVLDAIASFKGN